MAPIEATGKAAAGAIALLAIAGVAIAQKVDIPCIHHNEREHVQSIMRAALDESMKTQIMHLFESWLKDPTAQPERAIKGMSLLLRSYNNARDSVDRWNPPQCRSGREP
jgi:hypothetical protein